MKNAFYGGLTALLAVISFVFGIGFGHGAAGDFSDNSEKPDYQEISDIPVTPSHSGIDYSLYGGESGEANQIAFQHPNISVSSVASTGSMHQGISSQSMVITTSYFDRNTLSPGQIVLYRSNRTEGRILHRIHSTNSSGESFCYETKGDANFYTDPRCVEPSQIEELILGVIFRGVGQSQYCDTTLEFGPSSQYCPAD